MTRKNAHKQAARSRKEKLGGNYQAHLRLVGGGEAKAKPVPMRRCIYCLKDKKETAFNREHVVQQAFGVFDGDNLVLNCVCEACNQTLGDTIDLHLSRDSIEAFDRYAMGVKAPADYKSLGKRSQTRVEFDKDGPLAGAEGYFVAPPEGTDLGVTPKPRVGFRHTADGPFVFWAPLDGLPSKEELIAKGFQKGQPLHMQTQGEASPEEFRAALAEKGLSFTPDSEVPPLHGPVYVEAVFNLSRPQFRAIAKIAFNYLATVGGPDLAAGPEFNDVRRFILLDEGTRPVEVPLRRQAEAKRCHYVAVQTVGDKVVAHVSLFMRVMYYVVTLAPHRISKPLSSAHFFDLDTRRIIETAPIPVEPVRT
jgi:hypothetical protein